MKALVFIILFSISLPGFSQIKKAEKYFIKGKYEKSLEAVSKVKITKETKKSATLLKMKCNYQLYLQNKNMSFFEKGFGFYTQLYKSEKGTVEDIGFQQELKKLSQDLNQKANHKKAKVYCSNLAAYFKDSTDLYFYYFPKVKTTQSSLVTLNEDLKNSKPKVHREVIISTSEKYVGVPYKWAGEDSIGFDCSGFVLFIMRKYGFDFNHGAKDQADLGIEVDKEKAKPGDLLFFGKKYSTGRCKIDHVAMVYAINNDQVKVIHSTSKGVNIQELKEGDYWTKKILFYKNIID